jgi:hypothetical protein
MKPHSNHLKEDTFGKYIAKKTAWMPISAGQYNKFNESQ